MLQASPLPALVVELWGSPDVWFMYEQVFLKEGGQARRTPWRQDSSHHDDRRSSRGRFHQRLRAGDRDPAFLKLRPIRSDRSA